MSTRENNEETKPRDGSRETLLLYCSTLRTERGGGGRTGGRRTSSVEGRFWDARRSAKGAPPCRAVTVSRPHTVGVGSDPVHVSRLPPSRLATTVPPTAPHSRHSSPSPQFRSLNPRCVPWTLHCPGAPRVETGARIPCDSVPPFCSMDGARTDNATGQRHGASRRELSWTVTFRLHGWREST